MNRRLELPTLQTRFHQIAGLESQSYPAGGHAIVRVRDGHVIEWSGGS